MRRVAIVEARHDHVEVILPQVELLHGLFEVHVVAPESLLAEDLLRETSSLYHARPYGQAPLGSRGRRILGIPPVYFAIADVIDDIKPDVVVFNSTYRLPEVALIARLFRKYRKVQIIHNFQIFLSPSARWLYRSFEASMVISEQVHRYVVENHPQFMDLEYFLPIFFNSFVPRDPSRVNLPEADQERLVFGVFGSVDSSRRNYQGLFDALTELSRQQGEPGFQLHIVGNTPPWVKEYVLAHELQGTVKYFETRPSFSEMFYLLEHTDLVMFLIDSSVKYAEFYNKYKITGTSTLVKAFKKVGASSTDFPMDASLLDKCYYYRGTDVGSLMRGIASGAISREQIHSRALGYEGDSLFSFEYQQHRLVSALRRVMES